MNDPVCSPAHYKFGAIEVIDAIEAWDLDFNLGNAVKYIARHKHKGDPLQDLEKARWYLDREIQKLKKGEQVGNAPEEDKGENSCSPKREVS